MRWPNCTSSSPRRWRSSWRACFCTRASSCFRSHPHHTHAHIPHRSLLGWAAFSGYALLLLALPTTSRITKLAIRNRKRLSTARDKRMSVMNEMLADVRHSPLSFHLLCSHRPAQIKFIKFFAWEEHWIRRTLAAREAEISSMIRGIYLSCLLPACAQCWQLGET